MHYAIIAKLEHWDEVETYFLKATTPEVAATKFKEQIFNQCRDENDASGDIYIDSIVISAVPMQEVPYNGCFNNIHYRDENE